MGMMYCKWLTNKALRPVQEEQLMSAWGKVWRKRGPWDETRCWGVFIWTMLEGIYSWRGVSTALVKCSLELQPWLKDTADKLERHVHAGREEELKQRLADGYPGPDGLLHNICKWRHAWQPRSGSVSKQQLPADPQCAVAQGGSRNGSKSGLTRASGPEARRCQFGGLWRGRIMRCQQFRAKRRGPSAPPSRRTQA